MLEFLQGAERDLGKKMMVEWRENSGKKVRRRTRTLRGTENKSREGKRMHEQCMQREKETGEGILNFLLYFS